MNRKISLSGNVKEELPEEVAESFEQIRSVRVFEKNAVIYHQGEDANCFYYIRKGRVRIYLSSENGGERTLSSVGRGSIIGEASFFDGQPRMSSARAVLRTELVSVNWEMMTGLFRRSPQTAMALLRQQAQTIRMLSAQLNSMTFADATARIADYLLRAAADHPDSHTKQGVSVVTTHEEMAAAVGVSRVTVSKIMMKLSADAIVKTGYRCVRVLDINRLSELCSMTDEKD